MNPTREKIRRPLLLVLLVLLFHAYFFHFIGRESWNVSSRLNLTYALAEYGTFRIDAYHQNTGDKVFYDGHYYSDKAPGLSLLAVPGYLFFRWIGVVSEQFTRYWLTLLTVGLPSALGAAVFYGLTGIFAGLRERTRISVTLAYSLGTLALPFGGIFYGHQAAAVFSLAAFYLLVRVKRSSGPEKLLPLFFSGLLAGYAFLSDFPAGIILVLLAAYGLFSLRRKTKFALWLLGAALPVGFLLYYNYACFGSPLASSYRFHQTYSHAAGLLGITLPRWEALRGITFSPYRGLFYQSPVLLFAFPGFWFFARRRELRPEFAVCLLAVVGFFFFNSGYEYWDGVGSAGARFMIPALPFLALALALPAKRWPLQFAALAAVSFVFMLVMTATEPRAEWRVRNPLFYFNFFLFLRGYLSDNLGILLGLKGWLSLLPLLAAAAVPTTVLLRFSPPLPREEKDRREPLRAAALAGAVLLWIVAAGWQTPHLRELDKAESLFRHFRARGYENWSEVEEYYQRAAEYRPDFIEPYLRLAEIARMRGWPRVALVYYREISALHPGATGILLEKALVHDLLGETGRAEELLLRAVEISPGDPGLREQLAAFYLYHNRPGEALPQLEEARELAPREGRILRQLEEVRRALGE